MIAKRNHYVIAPLAQRLEAQMNGNSYECIRGEGTKEDIRVFLIEGWKN
jgi:hypothetical protein